MVGHVWILPMTFSKTALLLLHCAFHMDAAVCIHLRMIMTIPTLVFAFAYDTPGMRLTFFVDSFCYRFANILDLIILLCSNRD